jgi:putative heme transporter
MTATQTFRNTVIVLLTLLAAYTLVSSIRIIIIVLTAIIIASAIRPLVMALNRRRIPIGAAIVLVYVVLFGFLAVLFIAALPPIVNQIAAYLENDDRLAYRIIVAQLWVERLISSVTNDDISLVAPDEIRAAVSSIVAQIRTTMPTMLNDISATIGEAVLIFVMGAYWITSHQKATGFIMQLFPGRHQEKITGIINEIETKIGSYVRGTILIALISGGLNFAIIQVLGIPNALIIGLIVFITTTIPMIGGVLGFVLAVLVTVISSPQHLLPIIVITAGVQQLEAYVFGPRIMSNSVGLEPLLVIVYVAIGFVLYGVIGALIAVPVMGTIHIIIVHTIIQPHRDSLSIFETEGGLPAIRITPDQPVPPASDRE